MISDTSHLFRQLQLAFCLKKEEERRAREASGGVRPRGGGMEGREGGLAECEGCSRTVKGVEGGNRDG